MKQRILLAASLLLSTITFVVSSCDSDGEQSGVAKPVVALAEVGSGNGKSVVAGKDLHLESELEAEGLIGRIDLSIASADGTNAVLAASWTDGKYIGVRNATFHEHVDIPANTAAGDYELTLAVTDQKGQSTAVTSELKITVPADGAPKVALAEVGKDDGKTAAAGEELHLEADITAPLKIAGIEVELHNSDAGYEFTSIFTGKYLGETSVHFHEHIEVPADAPAGEYHLHFTVTDAEGNATTEEVEGIQITEK